MNYPVVEVVAYEVIGIEGESTIDCGPRSYLYGGVVVNGGAIRTCRFPGSCSVDGGEFGVFSV